MVEKRRLSGSPTAIAPTKRMRTKPSRDFFAQLSDELIIRILSFIDQPALIQTSLASKRLHTIASDSQLWRNLYYRRFILPRANRHPGFRISGKPSHTPTRSFSQSQRAVWAEAAARRSGISTPTSDDAPEESDWKRHYRLRHNWTRGQCAVDEVDVHHGQRESSPEWQTLVKVVEGLAVTVDAYEGIRAWDLKTRTTIASQTLERDDSPQRQPSCLSVSDTRMPSGMLDIAVGFHDGTFGFWQLSIRDRIMTQGYRKSSGAQDSIHAIACMHPYLLTATELGVVSLYNFEGPDHAPRLVTSLKSHSTRPPLALSIRKAPSSIIASVSYTFDTISGWAIGIQDLTIHASGTVTSRIASATLSTASDGPTRLCYNHPYLLATLPDNTLMLHLCRTNATSLSLSPATRLWGHTSGIADAEITPRGKAVSVSTRGNEIRLWELEGRVGGSSVAVQQRDAVDDMQERRSRVGFDDEMVVVLKEAQDGRDRLMVYDFT